MFNINDSPIKWKGRTYNEIVSAIKKNTNENASAQNTLLPNPCKIYRRTLPTFNASNITCGNERTSVNLGEYPGFTNHSYTVPDTALFIQKEYNVPLPYDTTDGGSEICVVDSAITKSLRLVRSAGMNRETPRFVSSSKMKGGYYANNAQYLQGTIGKECVIYNPNNQQFAQQGGVSYSNYILRKNYDINSANNSITSATYSVPLLYAQSIKMAVGDTGTLCAKNVPK
jgi:hypothetical protein